MSIHAFYFVLSSPNNKSTSSVVDDAAGHRQRKSTVELRAIDPLGYASTDTLSVLTE